jgi:hypothetical protein
MTGLEIEKTSGYWRKGFRKPDMLEERLNAKTVAHHPPA